MKQNVITYYITRNLFKLHEIRVNDSSSTSSNDDNNSNNNNNNIDDNILNFCLRYREALKHTR